MKMVDMDRLDQVVNAYFTSSPDWPLPLPTPETIKAEAEMFVADGGPYPWSVEDVERAMARFWRIESAERAEAPDEE